MVDFLYGFEAIFLPSIGNIESFQILNHFDLRFSIRDLHYLLIKHTYLFIINCVIWFFKKGNSFFRVCLFHFNGICYSWVSVFLFVKLLHGQCFFKNRVNSW